jgi:hypothetical protein
MNIVELQKCKTFGNAPVPDLRWLSERFFYPFRPPQSLAVMPVRSAL